MGDLMVPDVDDIEQGDFDHVHNAALMASVELTPQEERFVTLRCHGFGLLTAARHAGMTPDHARRLQHSSKVQCLMEQMQELYDEAVKVTRETVTVLLFEAHRKAASATEEIAAARELGKLHGLYKSDSQKGTNVTHNTQVNGDVVVNGQQRIQRMSTEDLLRLANQGATE